MLHDYQVGEMVDERYELVELLGLGGMGAVWRARDYVLDLDVALKLVRPREAYPGALERLLREARAAVAIPHPSVVRVLSFGQSGPDAYIAMEMLEGETIEALLERQRVLEALEAVRMLAPIAHALAAAHARGIVHRDVKPANILLSIVDGKVLPKLLDFGIARAQHPLPRRLTVTGQIMGTPHYMSPEQASGRNDVDERADVWALCAVLYEALAGMPPFDGDNYNAVLSAILLEQPPALSTLGVDPDLARLVERGLAKDRDGRYPQISELADALDAWLELETGVQSGRLSCTLPAVPVIGRPSAVDPLTPTKPMPAVQADSMAPLMRMSAAAVRRPPMWVAGAVVAAIAAWALVTASGGAATAAPRLQGHLAVSALELAGLEMATTAPAGIPAGASDRVPTEAESACAPAGGADVEEPSNAVIALPATRSARRPSAPISSASPSALPLPLEPGF